MGGGRWCVVALLLAVTAVGCTSGSAPASTAGPSSPLSNEPATTGPPPTAPSVTATPTTTAGNPANPVAPLSAAALAAGLVDVRTVVPDAIIDLR